GLLACADCGCRLMVNYGSGGRHLRYVCARGRTTYGEPECQSLAGCRLDALVAAQVLSALRPAALELHLAAVADVEEVRRREQADRDLRLERARHEAGRARRQYDQVEPENRLVARALERAWEEALQEQGRLEAECERMRLAAPGRLSEQERESIRALAGDLPGLWGAPTTTAADRQRVVRLLVERVLVRVVGQSERVEVEIRWAGGCVTRHGMARTVGRYEQLSGYARLVGRVEALRAEGLTLAEVAERLNVEGFHPPKQAERFTEGMVWGLMSRRYEGSMQERRKAGLSGGEWLLGELARFLGMPQATLHRWRKAGWVSARKLEVPGGPWAILATGAERRRMGKLRRWVKEKSNQPIPERLTTPAARKE
ncbi:MAG: zinc ribbon domain-containing protein, partial [Gemmataceae bacterium]|nr:zinc ribbon domain-containing protein [Gemmataceae bacterium]